MDENLNENKETLNTPEEEKETRWSRIRHVITPKRMKQAGAAVVLLAVLGVGGSAYTHYQHGIARAQAMETRSNILSNLAAKENIQLISADQARQVVAEALGTDAASLKIDSVMLDTPGFGQDKRFKKDKDNGGRKEFREKPEPVLITAAGKAGRYSSPRNAAVTARGPWNGNAAGITTTKKLTAAAGVPATADAVTDTVRAAVPGAMAIIAATKAGATVTTTGRKKPPPCPAI